MVNHKADVHSNTSIQLGVISSFLDEKEQIELLKKM
ncbi:hypothetical protein THIOSC13_1680002 [uncultured Thiomicrorhabdus sp.]